jgi:CRP-like cAMP-binding protein
LTRSRDQLIELGLLTDTAVFRKSIAALPLKIYQAGETVLAGGYTTGQLLILRKGLVAVAKEGVEIARVTDPGAVFGEISALLDQPHSADVSALTTSQFHVADAAAPLQDPAVLWRSQRPSHGRFLRAIIQTNQSRSFPIPRPAVPST